MQYGAGQPVLAGECPIVDCIFWTWYIFSKCFDAVLQTAVVAGYQSI